MPLYHYTCLVHLPPILREGLSHGEIAVYSGRAGPQAVSLTSQTDPAGAALWGGP